MPIFSHLHSKEVIPDVQRKPLAFQVVPISSFPDKGPHCAWVCPLHIFIDLDKKDLLLSLLPSMLTSYNAVFIGEMPCSLHHLNHLLLDFSLEAHYLPCSEESRTGCSTPGVSSLMLRNVPSDTWPNAAKDIASLLDGKGTSLTCSTWSPPGCLDPFLQSCFSAR